MALATYAIPNFLGGEISEYALGRFDKPDYRVSMRACLNFFPVEIGALTRRPGTMHAGTTRGSFPGRVMSFAFQQTSAVTLEFTDGALQFRSGATLISAATLASPYVGGSWAANRIVQAETTGILLNPTVAPYALTVTTLPAPGVNPAFALSQMVFNDGPYLDPFDNGAQAVPSAKTGIITLSLSFPAYDSTKAYRSGAFVTYSGVNYRSIQNQNVNHQPDVTPTYWTATSANAAINDGAGFGGGDIGRLVRMFSEPSAWNVATAYAASTAAAPVVVSYNPTGLPGDAVYYTALAASTGKVPGTDLTNWQLVPQGAAIWTWGRVVGNASLIDRALAGSVPFGNLIGGGGLAAAFDGVFSQAFTASASNGESGGVAAPSATFTYHGYVGKDFSGASAQKIQQVTVYPPSDAGFAYGTFTIPSGVFGPGSRTYNMGATIQLNLLGSSSAPFSSSAGNLLGTTGVLANTTSPITITSTDQVTSYAYVWVEIIATFSIGGTVNTDSYVYQVGAAELSMFNPPGSGSTSAAIDVEILGAPLLYTSAIQTWRLGVYSEATGWPTCGVYNDGRLYLGGAVANRFDACVANGMKGNTIDFAPTNKFGTVSAANAISYTFNSDGVNPILWMDPNVQGISMGTKAGEWLVLAPTAGPISPLNISARLATKHGSADVVPCRTEHTTLFVHRHAKKLLEYFPDVMSGKFSAPNLADKAQHLVRSGIAEIAYTSGATPIVWIRGNDGSLCGITYKRDSLVTQQPPDFYAWHSHALGSGRYVESICAGPSVGGDLDTLTMVTNDHTNLRHVEILTDIPDELVSIEEWWFLDNAARPATRMVDPSDDYPYGALALSALSHQEDTTVQVFAGGLDCGDRGETAGIVDFVVNDTATIVPFGDGISSGPGRGKFTRDFVLSFSGGGGIPIVVGYTYKSDAQITRPVSREDSGARNGPAFGKIGRGHRYAMKLVNTLGISVGGDFDNLKPYRFTKGDGRTDIDAATSFSGVIQETFKDDYGLDNSPCWRVSRPFGATIVTFAGNMASQDQ